MEINLVKYLKWSILILLPAIIACNRSPDAPRQQPGPEMDKSFKFLIGSWYLPDRRRKKYSEPLDGIGVRLKQVKGRVFELRFMGGGHGTHYERIALHRVPTTKKIQAFWIIKHRRDSLIMTITQISSTRIHVTTLNGSMDFTVIKLDPDPFESFWIWE